MVHVGLPGRSPSKPTYSFHSVPRTAWNKNKDKHDCEPVPYANIMFDRRVVRGPAFVQHPIPTAGVESQAAREAEARRRAMARRKAQRARILKLRVGTPPPVDGRKHEPVQTEQYLEEVHDHPVEMVAETQTDLMLDRPESPVYVPAKSGVDMSTQIQPGELFDFEVEVNPMLEVLVGKTLEQALVEVMEEEELEEVRSQQRQFKEMRDAELAEEERLRQQDLRRREEMELRVREHEEEMKNQTQAMERVAASVITTGYLDSLLPDVLQGLTDSGQAPDPLQKEVEGDFMKWLLEEVRREIRRVIQAEDFITDLVKEILEMRADAFNKVEELKCAVDKDDDMSLMDIIDGGEDETVETVQTTGGVSAPSHAKSNVTGMPSSAGFSWAQAMKTIDK